MPKVSYVKFYSLLLIPPWFYKWLFGAICKWLGQCVWTLVSSKSFVSFATRSEMWPLPSSPTDFPSQIISGTIWAVPIPFQCLWCSAFSLLQSLPSLLSAALLSSYWPCRCQPGKAFVKATAAPHLPLSPTLASSLQSYESSALTG